MSNPYTKFGHHIAKLNTDKISADSKHGKLILVTAISPTPAGEGKINAGFFVLSPKVLSLLKDDSTVWEKDPLESLANKKQLAAYEHEGFWAPMDTLRDKVYLDSLWKSGNPPWKKW